MQIKSQHVSSIPIIAGFHQGQADGIHRTAMGSAVGVILLGIEYWDRPVAAKRSRKNIGTRTVATSVDVEVLINGR
jgi:hypothetical protein